MSAQAVYDLNELYPTEQQSIVESPKLKARVAPGTCSRRAALWTAFKAMLCTLGGVSAAAAMATLPRLLIALDTGIALLVWFILYRMLLAFESVRTNR